MAKLNIISVLEKVKGEKIEFINTVSSTVTSASTSRDQAPKGLEATILLHEYDVKWDQALEAMAKLLKGT
jgi:hypothetical protein